MGETTEWVGRRIGHFVVEAPLGHGGMGVVYRLRHEQLPNTFAALKVLRPELADAPAMRGRFVQEALVAAALGGHRVARPLDLGRLDDGTHYIIMEYVPGRTLAEHLEAGALPLGAALKIAYRIADIMALAHAREILHRDLKPSNVMLVGDEVEAPVKLLDFGVARVAGELKLAETVENAIIGSPGYMSPEAASGLAVDGKSDVFSLGVTLYKMLTAELPFPPALDRASVMALLAAAIPPIASRRLAHLEPVPVEVEALLARALAKDASDRPSMAELRDALFAALRAQSPDDAVSVARLEPSPLPRLAPDALDPTASFSDAADTDLAALKARLEAFCQTRAPDFPPAAAVATSRRWWLAALAVGTLIAGGAVWRALPPRSPLFTRNARLACPPLRAMGVEAPTTWLGAAAAEELAQRVRELLSGQEGVALGPATLLDLPRIPTESFPEDPYGDPDARERSVKAARDRADAWFDGAVTRKSSSFEVELVLRRKDGAVLATAAAEAGLLETAVVAALDRLDRRAMPHPDRILGSRAGWQGLQDMEALLYTSNSGRNTQELCQGYWVRRAKLGPDERYYARGCAASHPAWMKSLPPLHLDRSSPYNITASAMDLAAESNDPATLKDALAALEQLDVPATSPVGRSRILCTKAQVWSALGDSGKAHQAALEAVNVAPEEGGWYQLVQSSDAGNQVPIYRAYAAWAPESSFGHFLLASFSRPEMALRFARRAFELDHADLVSARMLGRELIGAGRLEEVRALAAYFTGEAPEERSLRAYLLGRVDFAEGRLSVGFERLRRELLARHPGVVIGLQPALVENALQVGAMLGRVHELADALVERFVLSGNDDAVIRKEGLWVTAAVCFHASPPVLQKCAASLADRFVPGKTTSFEWTYGGEEMFRALQALARGDRKAMIAEIRKMQSSSGQRTLGEIPSVLVEVGAPDLAQSIDEENLTLYAKLLNGPAPSAPPMAERAFRRGDLKRARELAQAVVDHWSHADVALPQVAQMRALLKKLPETP
jgi:eukaryotic-like serine/threonine-protein kinase